jgi:hypothetical protein
MEKAISLSTGATEELGNPGDLGRTITSLGARFERCDPHIGDQHLCDGRPVAASFRDLLRRVHGDADSAHLLLSKCGSAMAHSGLYDWRRRYARTRDSSID